MHSYTIEASLTSLKSAESFTTFVKVKVLTTTDRSYHLVFIKSIQRLLGTPDKVSL